MDHKKKELINKLAEDIIKMTDTEIPITNLELVVNKLGGEIVEDYYTGFIGCSSALVRNNNGFQIHVFKFISDNRKQMYIAKELGHLFLHMGYKIDDDLWNKQEPGTFRTLYTIENEYEANAFALAFLMPKTTFKECLNQFTENNLVNTSKIAEFFGVSISEASARGKFLGYFTDNFYS